MVGVLEEIGERSGVTERKVIVRPAPYGEGPSMGKKFNRVGKDSLSSPVS